MSDLLLIPICIITGAVISRLKGIPENSYKFLNTIIIYIFLPALTFYYIPQLNLSYELIFPALAIWIIFLFTVLMIIILEKFLKWDKSTTGALILTAGLANTSFLGFPVLMAMFGEEGLKIGFVIDQAGSFLVLSTLGITFAILYSHNKFTASKIVTGVLKYPSFIVFILSVIMLLTGIKHSEISKDVFGKLGAPTIILALISVGMQLKIRFTDLQTKELICGLFCKMVLAPAIIFLLYSNLLNTSSLVFKVSIIETAMPPMVMGSVLASQSGLNPKLANQMVAAGLVLSIITLPIWYKLIS